jgi:glycosyltransferase involved in cell wall biosynthesis
MERLLVNHARFGDRDRFDYRAAYLVDRPSSVVPELLDLGVECTRLGTGARGGADPRWLGELARLVRSAGIDVVHTHSPLPAAMARPVLRATRDRPRLVYTEHNTWDCYGTATRYANLATYTMDDHQFAVSADAASSPPAPLARRVEVLTHGIDLAAVEANAARRDGVRSDLGLAPETVVVVTVANLRREKGHDVLLEAARTVLQGDADVVFLAVGHGPLEDELRARSQELGLGDRFRFMGFRSDALQLMAAADLFVLPSRQEGLPLAFMEAMALGLPAVVTSVGGLPDVVDEGVNGVLVPPESAERLARAVSALVGDPVRRAELAEGARAAARRFDARVAIRRQESVYAELVA